MGEEQLKVVPLPRIISTILESTRTHETGVSRFTVTKRHRGEQQMLHNQFPIKTPHIITMRDERIKLSSLGLANLVFTLGHHRSIARSLLQLLLKPVYFGPFQRSISKNWSSSDDEFIIATPPRCT